MALGLPKAHLTNLKICEGCILGKMPQHPFPRRQTTSSQPLQLVHSDLCGPFPTKSISGSVYFISFIDDYSKFTVITFLKTKNQALSAFKNYLHLAENLTNHKLKSLQTDGGGEYHSTEFINFCKSQGIHHRRSVPHTPQQNGTAERKNRSLLNAARSMLHAAKLESKFWEEAIATACYIQNRIYHHSLGFLTPFELWYGYKPHLQNLKIFGCPAFAHIPDTKRKKLDTKAKKAIFVGYGDAHGYKAYRLYNPNTNTFFFSRSVLFDEDNILQQHKSPNNYLTNTETDKHHQGNVTSWPIQLDEHSLHDPHHGFSSIAATPSSISLSLTAPSHHHSSDDEYDSTFLDTQTNSSHDAQSSSFCEDKNNVNKNQKFTSAKRPVRNSPSQQAEKDDHIRLTPSSARLLNPRPQSPLPANDEASSSTTYRTRSSDADGKDSHGLVRPTQIDHRDFSAQPIADLHSRNLKITSPSPHPSLSSHNRNDHSNIGHPPILSNPKIFNDFNSPHTPQTKHQPIPNTDTTPPRRLRKLSDIYQELDELECHFSDLDTGHTSNLDDVDSPHTVYEEPTNVEEALQSQHADHWITAMKDEMHSLTKNKTWDLVKKPTDRKIITCKWVLRIKYDPQGQPVRFKARLVARGFTQVPGIDFTDTFSPTLRITSFRLLVAIAAAKKLELHHLDVQTAFLHGDLEEEVYMAQPPYFQNTQFPTHVCKLRKSIYGLRQSPRAWYYRLHTFLIKCGYCRLKSEPNIYLRKSASNFIILGVYVDDFPLLSNSLSYLNLCKQELKSAFPITDLGPMTYFLGIEVKRNTSLGQISLSQSRYIDNILKRFNMEHCKPISTPLPTTLKLSIEDSPKSLIEETEMENIPYRQVIGSIRYLVSSTRPDLCFSTGLLSRFMTNPGPKHWQALKRILRYLKHTKHLCLTFQSMHSASIQSNLCGWMNPSTTLHGWTDADWGGDVDDRKSTSGYVYTFAGGAIAWRSKKQATVSLSSTEAEYVAATLAAKEGIWLKAILEEINFAEEKPIEIYCDNQSCLKLASNPRISDNIRHISFKHHFLRDMIEEKKINIKFMPSTLMWADFLTKPVASHKHLQCCKNIGLLNHTKAEDQSLEF